MYGVLLKSLREAWLPILLFGSGLFLFEGVITLVLPQIEEEIFDIWFAKPFMRTLMMAMLGTDVGANMTKEILSVILWVHPFVLAILWTQEMFFCTRTPAGEIDRGTVDVLLGLPVSRRAVYLSESAVWLGAGVLVLGMGILGHVAVGAIVLDEARPSLARTAPIIVNLFGVYVAVGGVAYLVSSLSDRRGRALGAILAILLASYLLNFVAPFWDPAARIAFLSVLDYYRPAEVLMQGGWPLGDIAVLLLVGASTWAIGGEVMARRSICTV